MSKLWTRLEMKTLRSINSLPTSPGEINFVYVSTNYGQEKKTQIIRSSEAIAACESYV